MSMHLDMINKDIDNKFMCEQITRWERCSLTYTIGMMRLESVESMIWGNQYETIRSLFTEEFHQQTIAKMCLPSHLCVCFVCH
jgi:uncharacterized protein YifN (PemK superfamily)